jgi:hypothetical protein
MSAPRRLAICIAQALSHDHFFERSMAGRNLPLSALSPLATKLVRRGEWR